MGACGAGTAGATRRTTPAWGSSPRRFLEGLVGQATAPRDATLAEVVARVPASRLPDALGGSWTRIPELRVRRARGQSFPDLIELRSGRLSAVPDAVARPAGNDDVRGLIGHAKAVGARLIPYGGGTSVVGGVSARPSPDPSSRSTGRSQRHSARWTSGAAWSRPARGSPVRTSRHSLAERGLTVGHEPQSFELATAGGWVAARGSGLRSIGAGRIEQLFAGGTLEAPAGTLDMAPYPASAAGPDLRQLVLGSEGRLGILTDVILRTMPLPEVDRLEACALPGWEAGEACARAIAQATGRPLGAAAVDAGGEPHAARVRRSAGADPCAAAYLRMRRQPPDWSLLLVGVAGRKPRRRGCASRGALDHLRDIGGRRVPALAGPGRRTRFRSPYLRNALWAAGYGSDTLETATDWARVPGAPRPARGGRSPMPSTRSARRSTCSPTCPTSIRPGRACT